MINLPEAIKIIQSKESNVKELTEVVSYFVFSRTGKRVTINSPGETLREKHSNRELAAMPAFVFQSLYQEQLKLLLSGYETAAQQLSKLNATI